MRERRFDDAYAHEARLSLIDELEAEIEAQKEEDAAANKREG